MGQDIKDKQLKQLFKLSQKDGDDEDTSSTSAFGGSGSRTARSRSVSLPPRLGKEAALFGERLKLARKRRGLSHGNLAERTGLSRPTLSEIERGSPRVSFGAYLMVLAVLGLERDIARLAEDDELGRRLQDLEILRRGVRKGRSGRANPLDSDSDEDKNDRRGRQKRRDEGGK